LLVPPGLPFEGRKYTDASTIESFLLRCRATLILMVAHPPPGLQRPEEVIRINPYEIMLLIEPDVPEERHREVIERVQQIVEKGKGSWGGVEPWGRRKLAYEIKHTGEAWYYVLTFDAPAPVLHEATRVLAITDGVMRHMAVARPHRAAATSTPPAEPEPAESPV
jgi:small subunit ribosomal protein S6